VLKGKLDTMANGYTVVEALMGGKDRSMNRRGSQKGTLIRRGNTWAVRYRKLVIGADGVLAYRQTTERVGSCDDLTLKQARSAADQLVLRANDRASAPASLATFGEFVALRFVPEWVSQKKPSGQAHYSYILEKLVLPTLASRRLCDVTPALVQGLLNGLAGRYSHQTVVHARNVIGKVMSYARLLGMVQGVLPTADVVCNGAPSKQVQALSGEQFVALVAAVPEEYKTLVRFVGVTGMRIGEALGLCWDAVNMEAVPAVRCGRLIPPMSALVCRAFSRGAYGTTKTGKSRIVPLTASLLSQLRLIEHPEGPVFRSSRGTPLDAHNLASRVLKPAGDAIGCPWIHWHALRHTAASLLDLDIAARQKVLGHMSPAMTVRYTHPEVETVRAAMEVIQ
jgi:integrase